MKFLWLEKIDNVFEKMKIPVIATSITIHVIYVLLLFGVISVNPQYIKYLSIFIQFFVCIFLMFRFHPFRKSYDIHKNDQVIIFYSAIFLLTNLGITEFIRSFLEKNTQHIPIVSQIFHKIKENENNITKQNK